MRVESLQAVTAPLADPGAPAASGEECPGTGSPFAAMVSQLSAKEPASGCSGAEGGEDSGRSTGTGCPQPRFLDLASPVDEQEDAAPGSSGMLASDGGGGTAVGDARRPGSDAPGDAMSGSPAACETLAAGIPLALISLPADMEAIHGSEGKGDFLGEPLPAAAIPAKVPVAIPDARSVSGEGAGEPDAGSRRQAPSESKAPLSTSEASVVASPSGTVLPSDVTKLEPVTTVVASDQIAGAQSVKYDTEIFAGTGEEGAERSVLPPASEATVVTTASGRVLPSDVEPVTAVMASAQTAVVRSVKCDTETSAGTGEEGAERSVLPPASEAAVVTTPSGRVLPSDVEPVTAVMASAQTAVVRSVKCDTETSAGTGEEGAERLVLPRENTGLHRPVGNAVPPASSGSADLEERVAWSTAPSQKQLSSYETSDGTDQSGGARTHATEPSSTSPAGRRLGEASASTVARGILSRESEPGERRLTGLATLERTGQIPSARSTAQGNALEMSVEVAGPSHTGSESTPPLRLAEVIGASGVAQGKVVAAGVEGLDHGGPRGRVAANERRPESVLTQVHDASSAPDISNGAQGAVVSPVAKASGHESQAKLDTRHSGKTGTEAAQILPAFQGPLRSAGAREPQPAGNAPGILRPDETVLQLADRIRAQVFFYGGEIRIHLRPAFLGQVEIRAEKGPDGVVARIVTESVSVREYLDSRLMSLETALQDQGVRVDRIEVSVREGSQSQAGLFDSSRGQGGHRGQAQEPSSGSWSARDASSENVTDPGTTGRIGPNSTFHTIA